MDLAGKVVVITGIARGLGHETALRLKAAGASVIGIDRIEAGDAHIFDGYLLADLSRRNEVADVAEEIGRRFGDVDILINNAGVLTLEQSDAPVGRAALYALDVNLLAPWQLTSRLLPGLLRRRGRVINVSSLFALVNVPFISAYAASKRALYAWSDILRANYRGQLTVTTVFPGFIDTAIHQPAVGVGLSVQRLVTFAVGGRTLFSLEEPLQTAAAGLVDVCRRRPRRNRGLTLLGTATMYAARWMPALVDAFLAMRLRALIRDGQLALRPELIDTEVARVLQLSGARPP